MKHLTFLPFTLLILISSTVLSQELFQFDMACDPESQAFCERLEDEFINVGKIISGNLMLNTQILVEGIYEPLGPNKFAGTTPKLMMFVSPDGVERLYPTALLKQLNTGIDFGDDADIQVSINSDVEDEFWFPEDGDIQPNEIDITELMLHELTHGLGFTSMWNFPEDRETFLTPLLNGDNDIDYDDPITFDGFYETIFDGFLNYVGDPAAPKRITDIAKSLNGFTAIGTEFPSATALYDAFAQSPQQEAAKQMLGYATTKSNLAFISPDSPDQFLLDTDGEFHFGVSINHATQDYENTADFLMTPDQPEGVTMQTQIKQTGNNPGGGIGPKLRSILKTLGYTINPNPPMANNFNTQKIQKRKFTRRNNKRKSFIRF